MKTQFMLPALLMLMLSALAFTGCKKDKEMEGTTVVQIRMTDAPGDFDKINLHVKEVILVSEGKPYSFEVSNGVFNVLDFRMGTATPDLLIANGEMPSGKVSEVRLVLYDSGNTIVVNGVEEDLKTPSAQSSGWKVKLNENPELLPGATYTLLLDFDAARSVLRTGNGKYILKPVVRGIAAATTGLITGTVLPLDAHPEILAISGTDTVGTLADAVTGRFTIGGLGTGNYQLKIVPVEGYNEVVLPNVSVTAGQQTDAGIIELK